MRDIGDVHREIEEILAEPAHPVATAPVAVRRRRWRGSQPPRRWRVLAACGRLDARPTIGPGRPRRSGQSLDSLRRAATVVRPSEAGIWRSRRTGPALPMPPRAGCGFAGWTNSTPSRSELHGSNPFFSPDGEWVGLFDGAAAWSRYQPTAVRRRSIAETTARPAGAAWRADGTIVFATGEGLFQVAGRRRRASTAGSTGSQPRRAALRLAALPARWPLRPAHDPVRRLCRGAPGRLARLENPRAASSSVEGGSDARYLPTGHLVYASGTTLKAVAFDPDTGTVQGDPVSLPGIVVATAADNGAANFSVSASGTLILHVDQPVGLQILDEHSAVDRS